MEMLVGYTGFVGQNLHKQHKFNTVFNSKNIKDAYNTSPDLCVYCGIRSEKFKADMFPDDDLTHVNEAMENISIINPKRLVLISTVDVIPFKQPHDIYEDTEYDTNILSPYGRHRLLLETYVKNIYKNALIIRLPALFGKGLKKNFIYDIINYVPAMLKKTKFDELAETSPVIKDYYYLDEHNFYRIMTDITPEQKNILKNLFTKLNFSALNFTDSRSKFSFYDLTYLWEHIEILLNEGVCLAHLANETVAASELYNKLFKSDFTNIIAERAFDYTFFKTKYAKLLGGSDGYIFDKETVYKQIEEFVLLRK